MRNHVQATPKAKAEKSNQFPYDPFPKVAYAGLYPTPFPFGIGEADTLAGQLTLGTKSPLTFRNYLVVVEDRLPYRIMRLIADDMFEVPNRA